MDHHLQGTPAARREGRPTVSLIISTYNRPRALDRVLAWAGCMRACMPGER